MREKKKRKTVSNFFDQYLYDDGDIAVIEVMSPAEQAEAKTWIETVDNQIEPK